MHGSHDLLLTFVCVIRLYTLLIPVQWFWEICF